MLQETIPLLIADDLKSLPTRHTPDAAAKATMALAALRARFAAGVDLASKLDARSAHFFEPSLDTYARKAAIDTADKQVAASLQKLAEMDSEKGSSIAPPVDRATKLWDGHAKGQLIDIPTSGLSTAAKAAAVDLLVTGTVSFQSGYAIVTVHGFDAILEQEAFAWKTFCAVDDPAPLASDIARRIELWVAGRAFARVEVTLIPASAELLVNDELQERKSPILYFYQEGRVRLEATASGYSPRVLDVDLAFGDRKALKFSLEPTATGIVNLITDPPGASISLDSVPIGQSPISIKLDGSRGIATASAKDHEPQNIVLPSSGESDLNIRLQPSDSLGPSGRLSAAKDRFYESLGWFVLSIPVTTLSAGVFGGYDEAYARSGDSSIFVSRNVAGTALIAAAIATGVTATFMVIRLIKYLGKAY